MQSESQTISPASMRRSLWIILFARIVIDTGYRAAYPFLPFIASNLGVSLASAAQIVQVRNLLGFASPLFGPVSDRYGRRVMMLAGLLIAAVMAIVLYFVTSLWTAILVMTLMGLSTILFVPAQQAFLGDNVPYAERGRAMALAEVAWSLAAIVGLPLVGILVEHQGWRVGFVAIGLFAFAALALVWFALPHEKRNPEHAARAIGGSYLAALRAPSALAAIGALFLLAAANENINITYGAWMNSSFGLDAVQLGLVASAIGGAEFVGELFAAGFVDRIGKWNIVGASILLGCIAYAVLPLLNGNAILGASGIVLVFLMFEIGVVAVLPLVTEIAPNARATLLSMTVAGFSLGRAAGSFAGPTLYGNYGFGVTSLVSAAALGGAGLIWFLLVREKHSGVAKA